MYHKSIFYGLVNSPASPVDGPTRYMLGGEGTWPWKGLWLDTHHHWLMGMRAEETFVTALPPLTSSPLAIWDVVHPDRNNTTGKFEDRWLRRKERKSEKDKKSQGRVTHRDAKGWMVLQGVAKPGTDYTQLQGVYSHLRQWFLNCEV